MKRTFKFSILVFAFLLISSVGISQVSIKLSPNPNKKIELISPLDLLYKVPINQQVSIVKQRSIFDANKLPLFCKIEHKLSKSSNVNLRMRLGSLDYVNKLEGKN